MELMGFSLGDSRDILTPRRSRELEAPLDNASFQRLFAAATNLYLRRPLPDLEYTTPLSPEAAVIEQLGTRGVRAAYELAHAVEVADEITSLQDAQATFIDPEIFSDALNRDALLQARQLGRAMSREMYGILGSDARSKVEAFKNAIDDDEQLEVLNWLMDRLQDITEDKRLRNELIDDDIANAPYNPLRLSAKAIGAYPHHRATPTCLGTTIAAAGFVAETGSRYLHGGVMLSRYGDVLAHTALRTSFGLVAMPDIFDDATNPIFADHVTTAYTQMLEKVIENDGYHACLLIELKSGAWALFDSNFNSLVKIYDEDDGELSVMLRNLRQSLHEAKQRFFEVMDVKEEPEPEQDAPTPYAKLLTQTANFLEEMADTAPGLEVTQKLGSERHISDYYAQHLETAGRRLVDSAVIEACIRSAESSEAIITRLFECVYQPFYSDAHELTPDVFYDTFAELFTAYVLDSMPGDEFVDRCISDAAFLHRAASTIRQLPYMCAIYHMIRTTARREPRDAILHPTVEVGLPDIRIGLAALSDLAVTIGGSPSPGFWLSNWSSLIPVTTSRIADTPQPSQRQVLYNNADNTLQRNLKYTSTYDMVTSSLQDHPEKVQHEEEKGESGEARGADEGRRR